MENASRSLIMAASVLLGVLLLSLIVYMFTSFSNFSSDMYNRIEDAKLDQFNAQFLKYYGSNTSNTSSEGQRILCTAHDIASLANLAKQSNITNELYDIMEEYDPKTAYVQIDVEGEDKALETWSEAEILQFIQTNDLHKEYKRRKDGTFEEDLHGNRTTERKIKYYICTRLEISDITKRVCYMKFEHRIRENGITFCECHE